MLSLFLSIYIYDRTLIYRSKMKDPSASLLRLYFIRKPSLIP